MAIISERTVAQDFARSRLRDYKALIAAKVALNMTTVYTNDYWPTSTVRQAAINTIAELSRSAEEDYKAAMYDAIVERENIMVKRTMAYQTEAESGFETINDVAYNSRMAGIYLRAAARLQVWRIRNT